MAMVKQVGNMGSIESWKAKYPDEFNFMEMVNSVREPIPKA